MKILAGNSGQELPRAIALDLNKVCPWYVTIDSTGSMFS